jgi:hypothetical protein
MKLKSVTLTQHVCLERWDNWTVAVPDDMDDDRIQELMRELWNHGERELGQEEYLDDPDEPSVDITEAHPAATGPHLTLTENGLLDRRRAKESDTIAI